MLNFYKFLVIYKEHEIFPCAASVFFLDYLWLRPSMIELNAHNKQL